MKIAIVVHGRFHAFDLARELIRSGQDVYVLTNYPKRIVARFGVPRERVRNTLLHGIVSRAANVVGRLLNRPIFEAALHSWFSLWAAAVLTRSGCDVIHSFSGVSEELFIATSGEGILQTLIRGSAHIEEQDKILAAEEERTGHRSHRPSEWMRARETREYELANIIIALSPFAYDSFVAHGVPEEKLRILLLGTQRNLFRPNADKIAERRERIARGEPLRVLTVGTFSLRKGAFDLVHIGLATQNFAKFRFVGTVVPRAKRLAAAACQFIEFVPKIPQFDLPDQYNWADVFVFPTLEDGYAVVLAQAVAAGLPLLATTNCAAPVLINEGENGWMFPIRRPDLFIEKLRWCDNHRSELASVVETAYDSYVPRDWSDVARDFVQICTEASEKRKRQEADVARA
jgi:glycosyltransferase involved in cell wall biosynthesis